MKNLIYNVGWAAMPNKLTRKTHNTLMQIAVTGAPDLFYGFSCTIDVLGFIPQHQPTERP